MSEAPPDAPPPYGAVAFDCDSTLSSIEGVEELFGPDVPEEIERLTRLAMEGELALEEVYGRRLELLRPTRADLERVGRRYVETALPHARELVQALRALGKRVAIVSGGLLPAVSALARHLGVDAGDVHAVDLAFDAQGVYADFDRTSPLARSGGKPELLAALVREVRGGVALVGDGATDLEAAGVVARFVAYGGVERRASVFAAARVSCDSPDLAALLPLLTTPEELERLAGAEEHRELVDAARAAL